MRTKWLTLFFALAVGIAGSGYAADGDSVESFDYSPDDATICSTDTNECRKVNCMDQCLALGEDPLECPAYCILEARATKSETRLAFRK